MSDSVTRADCPKNPRSARCSYQCWARQSAVFWSTRLTYLLWLNRRKTAGKVSLLDYPSRRGLLQTVGDDPAETYRCSATRIRPAVNWHPAKQAIQQPLVQSPRRAYQPQIAYWPGFSGRSGRAYAQNAPRFVTHANEHALSDIPGTNARRMQ